MPDTTVGNYGAFSDGVSSINTLNTDFASSKTVISDCQSTLDSDAVFMGPICDSCLEAFSTANSKINDITSDFSAVGEYLVETANSYQSDDKQASNTVAKALNLPSNSGLSLNGGSTQANAFYSLGDRAYNSDKAAQQEWIDKVANIVNHTNTHGMKKSLIIAQIINESGWMSSHASSLSNYNNVLGVNYEMGVSTDRQTSEWSKKKTYGQNNVSQLNESKTGTIPTSEDMRHYDSVEECIDDYTDIMSIYHPECVGSNNLQDYSTFLEAYTPPPAGRTTTGKYASIISNYGLEKYDT